VDTDDEQSCSQEASRKSTGDSKDSALATTAAIDQNKPARALNDRQPNGLKGKGSSQNVKGDAQVNSGKGSAKDKGKGASGYGSKGNSKGHGKGRSLGDLKLECQFTIGIEEDRHFHVVKRIIGTGGANMKEINEKTGAKLRLRGRGSKFLEGPRQLESKDDLMLCVSSKDLVGYEDAKNLVIDLLNNIYDDYAEACRSSGKVQPALGIHLHEGAREGAR
jgi:hypothetical protein